MSYDHKHFHVPKHQGTYCLKPWPRPPVSRSGTAKP